MENRPTGRQTHVTGQGSVQRRGSGLGTGPVGSGPRGGSSGGRGPSGGGNRGGGRSPLILIIIIVVALLGGGGGISSFLGGGGSSSGGYNAPSGYTSSAPLYSSGSSSSSGGWVKTANTGVLDTSVASGARDKRTVIKGNGQDTVTIMVYMCGTDLESRGGMATSDLQEMAAANIADNVNVIVYTGGCTGWKNSIVSNKVNQIYQVKKGGLKCLMENAGNNSMTDPSTLASFIQWCNQNYPANRTELILWDHGGGSLSGYGYDEKFRNGSMTLAGINQALHAANTTFDFIGFDACLMATVETGLMLDDYADYLIASEETEPGVGWYYTNWLNELSANTSMSTLEVGQRIVDDFVDTCARKCSGQKTTLSVIDLAELAATVPSTLTDFAKDTSEMIQQEQFQTVSVARNGAREFAQSSQIDQIDLVHFASNLGTEAGDALADSILGAVKYNRTSSNMTNAYGLSIYFPYKKASKVDAAVNTYQSIGMDTEYARCIQQFASMEVSGQAAAGGSTTASPLNYLMTGSSSSNMVSGTDAIAQLIGSMMGGQIDLAGIAGLTGSNTSFLTGRALDSEQMAEYISLNQFDPANLNWQENSEGETVISLSEHEWSLVQDLCLSVYYDDGEGYVDLGLDNVFQFDEDGNLIGDTDGSWLAINGQTVAYYYDSTIDDGENYTITGHVPALLNGERVNLILVFDNEHPYGFIAGANTVYTEEETDTIAKNMIELEPGDTLDFICDYYSYDGDYMDSYFLGEQMTVTEEMEISNVMLDRSSMIPMYRFTDIYQQVYWTETF